MNRPPRTDYEMVAASRHLHYEYSMFITLAHALGSGVFGTGPINNAVLESFIIHARGILDFFYPDRPRQDDVVASDYLDEQTLVPIVGNIPPHFIEARRRAGKEVAHLTYARQDVRPEDKHWNFIELAQTVQELMERFIARVPQERLDPKWRTPQKT